MRAPTICLAFLTLVASACGSVTVTGGAGGQPGAGGRGSGGSGTGGTKGGSGGTTGTSCAQLESDYSVELQKAKMCSPDASNQCQQTAPDALACGCPTFVNDRSALDQLQTRWNQAGCQNTTLCPAIACVAPKGASCRASDAGGASCSDTTVATP